MSPPNPPPDVQVFDLYYCSIASMQFHPGYNRDSSTSLSLDDCALAALRMMRIRQSLLFSDL